MNDTGRARRRFVSTGLALSLLGCGGGGARGTTDAGLAASPTYSVPLTFLRQLDLVILIDNSPGMAPKVNKLSMAFPRLIEGLRWPVDGTLPDLRLAVIDSDLGSGGAYTDTACGPKTLPDGTQTLFGDMGRFQTPTYAQECAIDEGALFLESKPGQPTNYAGDLGTVFGCLATRLGTQGCGEEHPLQAFEFALVAHGIGNERQQQAFLRGDAQLGLLFLSDEDDCSAAPRDALFGPLAGTRGESPSLRCATRAHSCNGRNLNSSPPGYPTDASFEARFTDCQARTGDECPEETDTSKPTGCNPLVGVQRIANELKMSKARADLVLVAGIFGWPMSEADMASATYKIAPVPNPDTADAAHPTIFDYWPVCYEPNHPPTHPDPTTGFDSEAAAWGATGGLRLSAFIDQFGSNGLKFSACLPDYANAMTQIGSALTRSASGSGACLPSFRVPSSECQAHLRRPTADGKSFVLDPNPVPLCNTYPANYPCYVLSADSPLCASGETQLEMEWGGGTSVLAPGTTLDFYCP